jgi:hypothetical protein
MISIYIISESLSKRYFNNIRSNVITENKEYLQNGSFNVIDINITISTLNIKKYFRQKLQKAYNIIIFA